MCSLVLFTVRRGTSIMIDKNARDNHVPRMAPYESSGHLQAWIADRRTLGEARLQPWREAFHDIERSGATLVEQELRWRLMHERAPCGRQESNFNTLTTRECPVCVPAPVDDCRHAYCVCPASMAVWRWMKSVMEAMFGMRQQAAGGFTHRSMSLELNAANIASGFRLRKPGIANERRMAQVMRTLHGVSLRAIREGRRQLAFRVALARLNNNNNNNDNNNGARRVSIDAAAAFLIGGVRKLLQDRLLYEYAGACDRGDRMEFLRMWARNQAICRVDTDLCVPYDLIMCNLCAPVSTTLPFLSSLR